MQHIWDPFVRIFHWSLVVVFTVAFYTRASERDSLSHAQAGLLVIYAMLATELTAAGSGWLVYNEGWLIDQPGFL